MTTTPLGVAVVIVLMVVQAGAQTTQAPSAATMPSTTRPATTHAATSFAIWPDPLANPVTAVQSLFTLIEKYDFAKIRTVNLQQATNSELRSEYSTAFHAGSTFAVVDSHRSGTVASVICRLPPKAARSRQSFI